MPLWPPAKITHGRSVLADCPAPNIVMQCSLDPLTEPGTVTATKGNYVKGSAGAGAARVHKWAARLLALKG